ncbi:hypothetical protein KKF34_18740 [Myxococcota bacterium]|nr:hypothetical protein [Myxococcota bacterium]MBU1380790.1 hypothetical protein [Myxococcota bacterium]MBU1498924.1 hypothetical protein [Myxococcota bacterium]
MKKNLSVIFSTLVILSLPVSASAGSRFYAALDQFVFGTSAYCYSQLDRTTYNTGFSSSDFNSTMSVDVVSGKIVLNTDQRALGDTNRIMIRTRQNLTVKYVYESADQSQTLGWFLWDNRASQFTTQSGYSYTDRPCSSDANCDMGESCQTCSSGCVATKVCAYPRLVLRDNTGYPGTGSSNGVYDWFEALYSKPSGSTNVYTFPSLVRPFPTTKPYPGYSWPWQQQLWNYDYYNLTTTSLRDEGTWPRISNFLEYLVDTGGGWLFMLADDDTDYETTVTCRSWDYAEPGCYYAVQHWQWGSFYLPPYKDNYGSFNGVPDYDVNGDGSVTSADRTVDMGTFDAGSELIFFLNSYYRNVAARYESIGMKKSSSWYFPTVRVGSMPYFSKSILNPDYKTTGTNTRALDIGCSFTFSNGYPGHTCSGIMGWLDQAAINRLNTADYNYLVLPHEIKNYKTIENGIRTHVVLGAPSTDPTRWLLGFEQLYDGGPGGEDNSGNDYNDVVILIERQNGGEAVSDLVATEIPASQLGNTTVTKVKITKNDYIPIPPCTPEPETRIDYYISISEDSGGNPIWILIDFPTGSNTATLDLASLGYTGAKLRWKVEIISPNESCRPEVRDVDIGYEALVGGDYTFSTPLPIANVMFKGTLETASSSWTVTGSDLRNRGHFYMYELYDASNPNATNVTTIWDAGQKLATRDPSTRTIYTNSGLTRKTFTAGTDTWLLSNILSTPERNLKHNGKPVYDVNGDGYANDNDARQMINWTRGKEHPIGTQPASIPNRAWPLGSIHRSTAAVVTPPGVPAWMQGTAIPPALKSAYNTWATTPAQAERDTIVVVGAQDGMLHAFNAGKYRQGDDPATTSIVEQRGYFKKNGSLREYGDGSELWAWIPPSQLSNLKNNYVKTYYPETHPWAQINGSVTLDDILYQNNWSTAIFYTHGPIHPYISALNVTDPGDPQIMWANDWTDNNYHGTYQPPAVAWFNSDRYGGKGKTWAVATTSGMSDDYEDVYLFLIDADDGSTLPYGKTKLNIGSGNAGQKSLGVWGSPVAIDFDGDGYTDRFYVADANGRVWKHYMNGTNNNRCLVADVGPEPIYVTPAFKVAKDLSTGQNVVAFYFGTADHPDLNDAVSSPYSFYAFVDRDADLACSSSEMIYRFTLPADEKVWADAFISGDEVYLGTSTGNKADICDEDPSNPGTIYSLALDANSSGLPVQNTAPVSAGGNVVSGLMVYDEHLFINSLGGKTKIIGGDKWNNTAGSSSAFAGVEDVYWKEQ